MCARSSGKVAALLTLLFLSAVTAPLHGVQDPTTVLLVRHAEASGPSRDPSLTEQGMDRARVLTHVVGEANPAAIFATQFKRTQETVRPLAEKLGLEVTVVEVTDVASSSRELARRILSGFSGKVVVVSGHSNTLPEIIEALGAGPRPRIDHHQYDDLFVVTVGPAGARSLRLNYGEPTR